MSGSRPPADQRYCLAKAAEIYLVYLASGGRAELNLGNVEGEFTVLWFNPRKGGKLQAGSVQQVAGGDAVEIGQPPADRGEDWVVLL